MGIQIRRDPAARWTSVDPVLGDMELGCESDTGKVKLGDGSAAWSSLNYAATTAPLYSFQGSTSGYSSGGYPPGGSPWSVTVDKFPFSSDGNATDVGDLTAARFGLTGQSSADNGYAAGGWSPGFVNVIDKFPFSTDANATDVGDLTQARGDIHAGQSSTTNGYSSGGLAGPPLVVQTTIDKFPFASDANATDVGDTTTARQDCAGQSSTTNGYTSGGAVGNPPSPTLDIIEKFPFSTDANATDVGDLTVARRDTTGQQV